MIVLANILLLYVLEYFFGEKLIRTYPNRSVYYFDMIFVFMVILFCVFFSTRFIKRSYENERNLVKERTRELEISNEKRTNVFINLAHETKTPLTLIINYLDDYMRKNGKEDDEELKLLKSSVNNLTKDIIDFFDMEKIQKGISMYDHSQISDFTTILNSSITLFSVFAAKKNIEVTSAVSNDVYLEADPSALMRIINNLVENAIKYTPEGGKIRIELSARNKKIAFNVKDDGVGIPLSQHHQIFEPYFQANSEKANFQGIGLGLSIVKKIVDELKGTIEIKSSPEIQPGTDMHVVLPQYEKKQDEIAAEANSASFCMDVNTVTVNESPFDESKFTLMIVEDNVSLLNYIAGNLQKDFNVYFALSGEEALEKLNVINHLDLIISDVMMDNGDGTFLYQQLSSSRKFNHIPFIFLTAKFSKEDKLKGLSMGAIDYISKPVSLDELYEKIKSILRNQINQREAIITNAYQTIIRNRSNDTENIPSANRFQANCSKYNLTTREIEVTQLLVQGQINKEIASSLFISVDTVKKHLQNVYEKAGVNNKFELFKKLGS